MENSNTFSSETFPNEFWTSEMLCEDSFCHDRNKTKNITKIIIKNETRHAEDKDFGTFDDSFIIFVCYTTEYEIIRS